MVTLRFLPIVCLLASTSLAASPELRGVWVTTTGITSSTSTVYNRAAVNTNFARLRNIGLNTVYMDVWRNGGTYFPSKTVQQISGSLLASDAGGRDLFGDTLTASHRNGMSQFAWLQYGFSPQFLDVAGVPSNTLATYMKNKGWLLQDAAGKYSNASNKFAWMNPLVPEVRQFVINMGVELVKKYDVDGIQFDDRLAWPVQFGYDAYTTNAYLSETGLSTMPAYDNANFVAWRAGKITAFAKEFSAAIRAANPNVIVAATPGVHGFVYTNYCVDSPGWTRETVTVNGVTYPLFDEVTPQVYNSTVNGFTNDWNNQLSKFDANRRDDYGVGISINNSAGAPYNWNTINLPQVNSQRATDTKGHIWWYSDGVLNTNEANLTAYYNVAANGHADRPDRPANWRPAPDIATAIGAGKWNVTLDEVAERYQVIARTGTDQWTTVLNTVLPAGTITLNVGTTYLAVEVLIDRRGFVAGDATFDGRVDLDDFFLLQRNFNATGALWTQGDFTLDGVVNLSDLNVLAQFWGTGTAPGSLPAFASLVPEPGMLLAPLLLLGRRRR